MDKLATAQGGGSAPQAQATGEPGQKHRGVGPPSEDTKWRRSRQWHTELAKDRLRTAGRKREEQADEAGRVDGGRREDSVAEPLTKAGGSDVPGPQVGPALAAIMGSFMDRRRGVPAWVL